MEKRLDAMLLAIKTVRPAFDAFYVTLTDAPIHLTCIKENEGVSPDIDRRGPHHF